MSNEPAAPSEPDDGDRDRKREKVFELVDGMQTAMLMSVDAGGDLHARPMAVAQTLEDRIVFLTRRDSDKACEIEGNPSVNVCFQRSSTFLSLAGRATVRRDVEFLHEIWNDRWKVWFPEGPDDPGLVQIDVSPTSAEYWDYSGMEGLRFLFAWSTAVLQGESLDYEDSEEAHGQVKL